MKKFSLALLAVAAALAIAPAALADTWTFSVSGSGLTGGGTLIGTPIGGGNYAITGGSITLDGFAATIIPDPTLGALTNYTAAKGADGWYFAYDNVLPPDDTGGILFLLSNGSLLEIWSIGGTDYYNELVSEGGGSYSWLFSNDESSPYGDPITFSVSATPEPSSLFLLGTGLIGLALLAFRKRKPSGLVLHA